MAKVMNILKNYNVILENIINSSNSFLKIPIYVINLNTDNFRRAHIKHILHKLNLNYTLVIVNKISDNVVQSIDTKLRKGIVGCCLSHLWCIQHAIHSKHSYFLILEDDVVFHKNFLSLFKNVNYEQYDMVKLGGCDFNLHDNLKDVKIKDNVLTIYQPNKIALGAYGNIYNVGFAKIILEDKLRNFTEFDMNFDIFYEKYKIGICYPNLVTCELSTTNLEHDYSLFNKYKNEHFLNKCFIKFSYSDYYFIWVIFLEYCYNIYKENGFSRLENYKKIVENFANNDEYNRKKYNIIDILMNNNYTINDINEMMILLKNDKYVVT